MHRMAREFFCASSKSWATPEEPAPADPALSRGAGLGLTSNLRCPVSPRLTLNSLWGALQYFSLTAAHTSSLEWTGRQEVLCCKNAHSGLFGAVCSRSDYLSSTDKSNTHFYWGDPCGSVDPLWWEVAISLSHKVFLNWCLLIHCLWTWGYLQSTSKGHRDITKQSELITKGLKQTIRRKNLRSYQLVTQRKVDVCDLVDLIKLRWVLIAAFSL